MSETIMLYLMDTKGQPVPMFGILETLYGPASLELRPGRNIAFITLDFRLKRRLYQLILRLTLDVPADGQFVLDAKPPCSTGEMVPWWEREGYRVVRLIEGQPPKDLNQPGRAFFERYVLPLIASARAWHHDSDNRESIKQWRISWNYRWN